MSTITLQQQPSLQFEASFFTRNQKQVGLG
jgi:hypothetical protein